MSTVDTTKSWASVSEDVQESHMPESKYFEPSSKSTETAKPRRTPLNIEEAAEYMNVSVRFVRDRRSDGSIPAIKMCGLLRFDPDDLDAYIDSCRECSMSSCHPGEMIHE